MKKGCDLGVLIVLLMFLTVGSVIAGYGDCGFGDDGYGNECNTGGGSAGGGAGGVGVSAQVTTAYMNSQTTTLYTVANLVENPADNYKITFACKTSCTASAKEVGKEDIEGKTGGENLIERLRLVFLQRAGQEAGRVGAGEGVGGEREMVGGVPGEGGGEIVFLGGLESDCSGDFDDNTLEFNVNLGEVDVVCEDLIIIKMDEASEEELPITSCSRNNGYLEITSTFDECPKHLVIGAALGEVAPRVADVGEAPLLPETEPEPEPEPPVKNKGSFWGLLIIIIALLIIGYLLHKAKEQ